MKTVILSLFVFPFAVSAQHVTSVARAPVVDSTFKVIRVQEPAKPAAPAFFINGMRVHESVFNSLDKKQISKLNILKDSVKQKDPTYGGEILITMKEAYNPTLITLEQLKSKYMPEAKGMTVITVDGAMVNEDYAQFYIDESSLLTIYIDKISIPSEDIDLPFIKVITKTEENIKKRNQIMIRGMAKTQ